MEQRRLGPRGPLAGVIGVFPGDGPERESVVRRARERGCTLLGMPLPSEAGVVRYNLLDQKQANGEIAALASKGKGVVAVHVLAGGAIGGGREDHPYGARVDLLRGLIKPGRTLVQAAVQFVLANESVSAAMVRVSTVAHLDEVLDAPEAPPLTGQDLELIFELWANRFD